MQPILTLFLLISFTLFSVLNAHVTDHSIYPVPSPPVLPSAGGTFVDQTFGTTLMRVTDASDGNDNHHAYSYWPCMNKSSTRLYVMQTSNLGPTLYDFDTLSFAISNKRAAFASVCPSGYGPDVESAIWSDLDPDLIFVHDRNMHIYSYNVVTNTYTLVKDLTGSFSAGSHTRQMNKNHTDDDVFTFTLQDASWNVAGVFAWRKSSDQLYTYSIAGADECQSVRAGKYLVVKTGNSGQYVVESKIIEFATGTVKDLFDGGPANPNTPGPYWGPGHGDHGSGTVMGNDNWNNRFLGRRCANADSFYVVHDWQGDWSQDYHASGLSDDESRILLSTYVAGSLSSQGYFKNEIFLVSTDGKDSVLRIAHHHSDYVADYNANGGGSAYWSSPKGSISKNGKWVTFTSNWGSVSRRDVFVAKVPYGNTTSLQENALPASAVSVHPNPISSQAIFSFKEPVYEALLKIYDLFGREIRRVEFSGKQIILQREDLVSGLYFYQITSGSKSVAKGRVVVQ